jgi:hypothetical protein
MSRFVRPFKVTPKSDGRPAVEVEFNNKQQQYVSHWRLYACKMAKDLLVC